MGSLVAGLEKSGIPVKTFPQNPACTLITLSGFWVLSRRGGLEDAAIVIGPDWMRVAQGVSFRGGNCLRPATGILSGARLGFGRICKPLAQIVNSRKTKQPKREPLETRPWPCNRDGWMDRQTDGQSDGWMDLHTRCSGKEREYE